MRHLIAFDLDGTLIDSRLDLADSANELLTGYGAAPLEVDRIAGMVGHGARTLVGRALVAAGIRPDVEEALDRFLAIYERRLTVHTRVYPGLIPMVQSLAGRTALAVLTNKPARHTRLLLDHFDVSRYFGWVVGGDSGYGRKPDPGGLLHLVEAASVPLDRALYVGDSPVDAETAKRAGTRMCMVGYGFGRFGDDVTAADEAAMARAPEDLVPVLSRFLES